MDEALFEVAHLVADLARVDGTVIMTDCLELLGFGVEVAGELPEVLRVARAHDLEGAEREWVRTDRVGTMVLPIGNRSPLDSGRCRTYANHAVPCDLAPSDPDVNLGERYLRR
jgi:hypothetical protein